MSNYAFRAVGGFLHARSNDAYQFSTGDFTIEAWVKTKDGGPIVSRKDAAGGPGNGGFILAVERQATLKIATDDGFGFYEIVTHPCTVLDGNWHHLAAVREQGKLSLYFDGFQIAAEIRKSRDTPLEVNNQTRLLIAHTDQNEPSRTYTGLLDEVRLWKLARTSDQILCCRDHCLAGDEPGLVGYWNFDQQTTKDYSPTHNDAIADGAVDYYSPGAPRDCLTVCGQCLLGYYPLKGDAQDYSGNDKHGSASSAVQYVAGPFDRAAAFLTSGARVSLPAFQRYSNNYTVSAWIYLQEFKNVDPVPSDYGTILGPLVTRHSDGNLQFRFAFDSQKKGPDQSLSLNSKSNLPLHKWVPIAVSYDHSTRRLGLFINRVLDSVHDLSSSVSAEDRPHMPARGAIGGPAGAPSASESTLNGWVSDVFILDMTCRQDAINLLGNIMTVQAHEWEPPPTPTQGAVAVHANRKDCAPAWWWIIPLIGQIALYRAAVCSTQRQPDPPPSLDAVVEQIVKVVGKPAMPGKKATRSNIGIDSTYRIHVDVGGEGLVQDPGTGYYSGFRDSINLNDRDTQSSDPKKKIPYLVRIRDWDQEFPFGEKFANYVTLQSAPLTDHNVLEISRILAPGGEIALWIDVDRFWDNIERLAGLVNGYALYNAADEFSGSVSYPKTKIVLDYHDEL